MDTALARLAEAGFDLAHDFDTAAVASAPGLELLAGPERLGILIGNTRALWPPFSKALRDPSLAGQADPLERYTERAIDAAFPGARLYYAHVRYGGAFVPMQRLAVAIGLGALAPSQLVIHPIYGPWFAMRAVVLLHGTPPARQPIAQPCTCSDRCAKAFALARDATDWRPWLAVRDACSLRDHRYGDDQLSFHYTRMRRVPRD